MDERQLVEALIAIQRARNLSDAEMAKLLCVGRAQWGHIRLYRRGLGLHSLGGVMANFGDLREVAASLVARRATQVPELLPERAAPRGGLRGVGRQAGQA
jgi:hypothetical protein